MKVTSMIVPWLLAFAVTTAAQGAPSNSAVSSGKPSKAQLSEIRSLVHDLQALTDKLRELMGEYRSLVEQRPRGGGRPADKSAGEDPLAKWNTALERLMRRVDAARVAVVETTQRLDQLRSGQLPTALAKDVANARNEAEAQRTAAEQALAKNKSSRPKPAKQAAQAERPAPPIPDDL